MAQPVPYFPPPPISAALSKSRSKSKTSSSTAFTTSSEQVSKPSPLHRSRTYLLPVLLVLTFAVFILTVIYGYCVATPYKQATPKQIAAGATDGSNSSIYARGSDVIDSANGTVSSTGSSSAYAGSQEKVSIALILYLVTTPTLLMGLFSTELILQYVFPSILNGRHGHIILCSSYTLSSIGLILSSAFWTACELPTPHTTALERICPAQIRGHFMYGIHELSIAKAAIAWVVVAGIMWHTLSLFRSFRSNRCTWTTQRQGHELKQGAEIEMEQGMAKKRQQYRSERKRDRFVRFLPVR